MDELSGLINQIDPKLRLEYANLILQSEIVRGKLEMVKREIQKELDNLCLKGSAGNASN